MKKVSVFLMLVAVYLPPAGNAETIERDFQVATTANLLRLCMASDTDPRYREAIHFCHGYLVGAFHYYRAQETGPKGSKFLCIPEAKPSRNETIKQFIEWAQQHPEYRTELPVETEFRFLTETWPCKSGTQKK